MPVLRPWMDNRDPWRWIDNDPEADPTVFVPYLVHLEPLGDDPPVHQPTMWTTFDERGVFIQYPGGAPPVTIGQPPGGVGNDPGIPLDRIRAGRVDIRPVPADWYELRAGYPWAYERWHAHEAREVYQWVEEGRSIEEIATELARPPEHVAVKLARVRALVESRGSVPPRVESTPYGRHGRDEVAVEPQPTGVPDRLWYDEDPEADPTVHLPFVLHLRRRDGATDPAGPVLGADLRADVIRYRNASDGLSRVIRRTEIADGHLEFRPPPADQERMRTWFPAAYLVWPPDSARQVLEWGRRSPDLAVDLRASELGRPPEHLRAKYRQLEERARAERVTGQRAEPAPHHRRESRVEGEYIVAVREVANAREVAARAGVTDVRFLMNFIAGRLSDEQLAALRADPDVEYVQDNAIGRLR